MLQVPDVAPNQTHLPINKTKSNLDLKVMVYVRKKDHVSFLPDLCVVRFDPSSDPPSLPSQLHGHLGAPDRKVTSALLTDSNIWAPTSHLILVSRTKSCKANQTCVCQQRSDRLSLMLTHI